MTHNKNAIILLSGGLDSATVLSIAKAEGFTPHALSFDYGQRHRIELEMAAKQAATQNVQDYRTAKVDLTLFGGSALTADIAVPKNSLSKDIPVTYVPARNTIFLSYALAFAETVGAADIFIGVNALDYSGYPDCRPEYIKAFESMANLATKAGVEGKKLTIHTPLIALTKAQIIQKGLSLGVDYSHTLSCYDPAPDGVSCGACDSCLLRKKGFTENKMKDPIRYA